MISALLPLPAPVLGLASRIFAIDQVEEIYGTLRTQDDGRPFLDRLLAELEITCTVCDRDLAHVPRSGPAVFVANHPFGILEGAVIATVLQRIRRDVRLLANGILGIFPEVRDLLLSVDPMGGAERRNSVPLRRALEFLRGGGLLVVFPAGEVSHFQWSRGDVSDPEWNPAITRMIEICARHGVNVPVVPAYVHGGNSLLFQAAGVVHPRLRTALLARELFNKRRHRVDLRIGAAINSSKLLSIEGAVERTAYLRWRTYLLANRQAFKPRTALPHRAGVHRRALAPLATPVDAGQLAAEIDALPPESRLASTGDLSAYIAPAHQIPGVLKELGRLREKTFRAAGEGTGRSCDLDAFDKHYLHLFVWHSQRRELVGAYRLAATDQRLGNDGLYTASLFRYGQSFLDRLGPALELGRSFVREEYQRGFAPLLLLWKGIGKYVAKNPRYRTLFGPVSISNSYQALSRELMVSFLEKHASLRDWMGLVTERHPFCRSTRGAAFPNSGFDVDDLSEVVSDIEPTGAGIPVLLRQYLKLGGKLLGFNVDPEFSDALDGLILVDLTRTEPKLLHRYLGGPEAAAFLEYQKGQHGTL
ncbi:GNAT family N-acyltransferase [uncultured Paludibaculum sp.]|uniref:lysophospholipid acyltransferase family protein n=1 Tax=uncultured Paludibaculum sp. TaxID=1765020 RepID=UPI002AAC0329|nr:GNAT family N-acyltransferase [uncultured Paludibaculum sp.]